MLEPEDQERIESTDAIDALQTSLMGLAGASLLGLSSFAPKAVNRAAAALRREAMRIATDGMAEVDGAVERDLTGQLVLSGIDDVLHAERGSRKARAMRRAVKDAQGEARKAAREVRRQTRRFAACMVDDLNRRFLQEAARARKRIKGDGARGIEGANHRKVMTEAIVRLAKDGLAAYTYRRKDGAIVHVPADVGIRRHIDNAGKVRQIDQTIAIASRTGQVLVEVSTTVGARKSHAEWQGKRYMLKGSSAKYPNFAKACKKGDPVDGIGGYNCRHQISICREGEAGRFRDPLKGTGYSQERARTALTAQRGMENDLRKLKRQREVLRMNGLDTEDVNGRIKALDKGLDEFVAQHSKILRRERHRESIYERARKAAKAEGVVWTG